MSYVVSYSVTLLCVTGFKTSSKQASSFLFTCGLICWLFFFKIHFIFSVRNFLKHRIQMYQSETTRVTKKLKEWRFKKMSLQINRYLGKWILELHFITSTFCWRLATIFQLSVVFLSLLLHCTYDILELNYFIHIRHTITIPSSVYPLFCLSFL